MPKPITPLVGCDVYVTDPESRVLLVRRSDDGLWALPGGCQDLGETPAECAVREVREETGFQVELIRLMGVFSSARYEYINYPWKDNEFTHLLFEGRVIGGELSASDETPEVRWCDLEDLPSLSDGHGVRIEFARSGDISTFFE